MTTPQPSLTTAEQADNKQLAAVEKLFDELEFWPLLGGWVAVPKGIPVVAAMTLEVLETKLRLAAGIPVHD
jgi:hypothetical protein